MNPQIRGLSQSLKHMQFIGKEFFKDTKVKITNSGKRFLGSVIGIFTFKKQYIDEIVSQ